MKPEIKISLKDGLVIINSETAAIVRKLISWRWLKYLINRKKLVEKWLYG